MRLFYLSSFLIRSVAQPRLLAYLIFHSTHPCSTRSHDHVGPFTLLDTLVRPAFGSMISCLTLIGLNPRSGRGRSFDPSLVSWRASLQKPNRSYKTTAPNPIRRSNPGAHPPSHIRRIHHAQTPRSLYCVVCRIAGRGGGAYAG